MEKLQTENGNPSPIIYRYITEATEFLASLHKDMFDKDDYLGYSEIIDATKVAPIIQEKSHYNVMAGGAAPHDNIQFPYIGYETDSNSNIKSFIVNKIDNFNEKLQKKKKSAEVKLVTVS